MTLLIAHLPWLVAMSVLVIASGFCSASEAAWFSLRRKDVRAMARGNRAQQLGAALLDQPDRLLTAILFWNLLVNVAYFSLASITSLRLERAGRATAAGVFAVAALLALIVLSEMLPKSLAVLAPRAIATIHAAPLSVMVRLLDPIMPCFRWANLLSMRLFWPGFRPEPYLRVADLERAVKLSTDDASLLAQEQNVLRSIVSLSEIRADELMRPRTRFRAFRPPVSRADLGGWIPASGYLLLTEPDGDEVAAAVDLQRQSSLDAARLDRDAEPVVYVPWCTTVAAVLEQMRERNSHVAAVVNEFGETIGVFTFDDVLDTIFTYAPSRSERLLKRVPIRQHAPGVWHVTGMTSLRRLVRFFQVERPPSKSVTVAGVIQEVLERLPETGDQCRWGPFTFTVLDVPDRGQLLAELRRTDTEGPSP
ncbi:MAG: DUF21 domain-containing protein [Pirellulales bacterium]|nr:DUF21 domain-containing protein [Pirellulales bacterium]